jgi:hypothetical protein
MSQSQSQQNSSLTGNNIENVLTCQPPTIDGHTASEAPTVLMVSLSDEEIAFLEWMQSRSWPVRSDTLNTLSQQTHRQSYFDANGVLVCPRSSTTSASEHIPDLRYADISSTATGTEFVSRSSNGTSSAGKPFAASLDDGWRRLA